MTSIGLLRLQAELFLAAGQVDLAHEAAQSAIRVADGIGAPALRAATTLYCIERRTGVERGSRKLLEQRIGVFADGVNTVDLREAREAIVG